MVKDQDEPIAFTYNDLIEMDNDMKKDSYNRRNAPMLIVPKDLDIFNWKNPEVKYDKDMPSQKILIFNNKG